MRFTQAFVDRVKYTGKQAEYFDRGLVLGVNKNSKVWKAKIDRRDDTGRVRTIKTVIGDAATMSLKDARVARDAYAAADARRGPRVSMYRPMSLRDCVAAYGRFMRDRKRAACTIHQYNYNFTKYLGHWLDRRALDITDFEARAMHDHLTRTCGQRTANAVLQSVRSTFRHMHKLSKSDFPSDSDPTSGVFWHTPRKRTTVIEDFPKWWSDTAALTPLRRAFHRVNLLTGLRPGAVRRLKWEYLDGDWLTIPGTVEGMKAGRDVRVPLSAPARAEIDTLPRVGPYMFPARGGGPLVNYYNQKFIYGHNLRRTYHSIGVITAGVSTAILEILFDHMPRAAMAKHYTNAAIMETEMMTAQEAIGREIERRVRQPQPSR